MNKYIKKFILKNLIEKLETLELPTNIYKSFLFQVVSEILNSKHIDDYGYIASYKYLSKKTERSVNTVRNHIEFLVDKRILIRNLYRKNDIVNETNDKPIYRNFYGYRTNIHLSTYELYLIEFLQSVDKEDENKCKITYQNNLTSQLKDVFFDVYIDIDNTLKEILDSGKKNKLEIAKKIYFF